MLSPTGARMRHDPVLRVRGIHALRIADAPPRAPYCACIARGDLTLALVNLELPGS